MTIKSDKWIRRMCIPPDGIWKMGGSQILVNKIDGNWVIRENGLPAWVKDDSDSLTIFTDEQKADFLPMIEPFEAGQVKTKENQIPPFHEMYQGFEAGDYEKYLDWKRNGFNPDLSPSQLVLDSYGVMHEYERLIEDRRNQKIVSYGTSSYGYDLRCSNKFKIFTNINSTVIDPKNFDPKSFVDFEGDVCIIPPNSFALASSVEYFRIPRNVLTVCLGKSTYARCGIVVNVTPFEPEWEGHVTLEFSNTTPLPAMVYANEGVAQVLFLQSDETCDVSYKDRQGKYMGQAPEPIAPKC